MARKRVSRSRKRDLEQPDRFTNFAQNLLQFATKHKVYLCTALGLIITLSIAIAAMLYFANKAEDKALALLAQSQNKYQTIIKNSSPDQAYSDVADDFKLIMQKYSGKIGGKLARFMFANICYQAGKYDQAIELYNQSLSDFGDNPFIKNLILSSLGYSHEAKKEFKTAAKYFEMLVSAPDYRMKDEALFNLAQIYAGMGNYDRRLNALKKIVSDYNDSMYLEIAKENIPG
ncbi:MAG: tetratricopeptide repeat protein [Candidatus Desulfatibia sp.]|uniref:tetratricopeptide repeat protein n=1 Tax=Candidatus Desulfatibia sp. TaxID=3101189 RepID=UPI002F3103CD